MNNDLKLFLMILLILGIGFATNKIDITGNAHLVEKIDISLDLDSDPQGASVYLSGSYMGQTPLTLTHLQELDYNILLKKINYYDLSETVKVTSEQNKETLVLTKVGEGNLVINSNVESEIYINNEPRGITPRKISLKDGVYDIKIRKNGYSDFFTSKLIKAGQNENLYVKLDQKDVGSIFINSEPSGKIFVDEKYAGETPNLLSLPIGNRVVQIEKEGYDSQTFNINVEKNEKKEIFTRLTPGLGTLLVASGPLGSSIYIDGEYMGITPKIVTGLNDGIHTLKLSKEYYNDYVSTINIKRLFPNKIYVDLERK